MFSFASSPSAFLQHRVVERERWSMLDQITETFFLLLYENQRDSSPSGEFVYLQLCTLKHYPHLSLFSGSPWKSIGSSSREWRRKEEKFIMKIFPFTYARLLLSQSYVSVVCARLPFLCQFLWRVIGRSRCRYWHSFLEFFLSSFSLWSNTNRTTTCSTSFCINKNSSWLWTSLSCSRCRPYVCAVSLVRKTGSRDQHIEIGIIYEC